VVEGTYEVDALKLTGNNLPCIHTTMSKVFEDVVFVSVSVIFEIICLDIVNI
jgi:hypothetical protein